MTRNALCACGSGKRFKYCHGRLDQPQPSPLYREALMAHQSGALSRAITLYREVLEGNPDDANSLHMLGVVEFERMHFGAALDLLWKACILTNWGEPVFRQNLGLVLAKLLSPSANARQEALVRAYTARERERRSAPVVTATVSVVLPACASSDLLRRAIASVAAQSYTDLELLLVEDGSGSGASAAIAEQLADFPFPSRSVRSAQRGLANAINAGAESARGRYLALLDPDDCFAPARIERMIAEMARSAPLWGFSQVIALGATNPETIMFRAAPINEPASFSFLDRDVMESYGNLFVERDLFRELGGYHSGVTAPGWEFGRRASITVEPVVIEEPLYLLGNPGRPPFDPRREHQGTGEQTSISPVIEALMSDAKPANEFCPEFQANREMVLRTELRANRADRLPVDMLRSLASEWRERVRTAEASVSRVVTRGVVRKTAIVVLGIYRSGTSAVSGVLNYCGAFVAEQVKPARLGLNRKGFWESEAVNDIDARLLHRLGGNWDRVDFELPSEGPLVDEFLAQIRELLTLEYGAASLILIKDPRICVLAPLWNRALVECGYRATYVVTVRNPLEVAQSLERQGSLTVAAGLALWQNYMSHVERFAQGAGAAIAYVEYGELLEDWRGVVGRVASTLDVELHTDVRAEDDDRFLESEMRNHRATENALDALLNDPRGAETRALYHRLRERCRGGAGSDHGGLRAMPRKAPRI